MYDTVAQYCLCWLNAPWEPVSGFAASWRACRKILDRIVSPEPTDRDPNGSAEAVRADRRKTPSLSGAAETG